MYVKPLVITGMERGNMLTPSALISTETEDGQAVVRRKGTQQRGKKWKKFCLHKNCNGNALSNKITNNYFKLLSLLLLLTG